MATYKLSGLSQILFNQILFNIANLYQQNFLIWVILCPKYIFKVTLAGYCFMQCIEIQK